jgi:hypothetical protein
MTLYVVGGIEAGNWTTSASSFDLKAGMAKKCLPDIMEALIGPNAIVIDTAKSLVKLIVSG